MMHSILHLCTDGNFIDKSISVFEHFYPGQNCFFLCRQKQLKKVTYAKSNLFVEFDPYSSDSYLDEVEKLDGEHKFDIIMVHGHKDAFVKILKRINSQRQRKVYWIFWGYEMYFALGEDGKMPLVDNQCPWSIHTWMTPTRYSGMLKRLLRKPTFHDQLIEYLDVVDYFCFWLYEDFELLQRFYPNTLKYKHFQYGGIYRAEPDTRINADFDKVEYEVRVDHSASITANHLTVMKKLKEIDRDNVYKKIFPLAYGSDRNRKEIMRVGKKYFGEQFVAEIGYVPRDEYFRTLSKTGVALFGQLRQEASGNIFPLIRAGAKVFMRKQNPLFSFCKRKGYIVFSLEDDLNTLEDLRPLSREQMLHNVNKAKENQVYYEDFMPYLFEDIDSKKNNNIS